MEDENPLPSPPLLPSSLCPRQRSLEGSEREREGGGRWSAVRGGREGVGGWLASDELRGREMKGYLVTG